MITKILFCIGAFILFWIIMIAIAGLSLIYHDYSKPEPGHLCRAYDSFTCQRHKLSYELNNVKIILANEGKKMTATIKKAYNYAKGKIK